jgi:hypothetical protein
VVRYARSYMPGTCATKDAPRAPSVAHAILIAGPEIVPSALTDHTELCA